MDDLPKHKHFVPIAYFAVDMLGFKNVVSYYDHRNEPGFPQRVYPTGKKKPMLVYEECVAYMERVMNARNPEPEPVEPPRKTKPPAPSKRRRTGRPVGSRTKAA